MDEEKEETRQPTQDCRQELFNKIIMALTPYGIDLDDVKNRIYVLMEPYEITSRCTQVAVLEADRNEYLLKKFYVAKTVQGCTQRTLTQYIPTIRKILNDIGKTVDDITADDVRYYLALRQTRDGISKRYADTLRRYISSFFKYLSDEELIRRNPMVKIPKIKFENRKKKAFTEMEIEKLRMAARDTREKAIIEFLLSTGCRVTEAVNVKIADIEGERILVHGKGQKDRYVYLNAKAEVAIEAYLKERKDKNPYLFPGTYKCAAGPKNGENDAAKDVLCKRHHNWWKYPEAVSAERHLDIGSVRTAMQKLARHAGVEEANPHKFRRTCATMALRRGMSLEQVSKMLGHEELSTTQIYLDLTEEDLAQAHKKYVV